MPFSKVGHSLSFFLLSYSFGSFIGTQEFKNIKERAGKGKHRLTTTVSWALKIFLHLALNPQEPFNTQESLSLCPCGPLDAWCYINSHIAIHSHPAVHWWFLSVSFQKVSALTSAKLLSSLRDQKFHFSSFALNQTKIQKGNSHVIK